MDGVWFQSVEQKSGMDEAMYHDMEAWRRYTVIEARRIKQFLNLPEHPGLEGLAQALQLRFYTNVNEADLIWEDNGKVLIYPYAGMSCSTCPRTQGNAVSPLQAGGRNRICRFCPYHRRPPCLQVYQLLSGSDRCDVLLQLAVLGRRIIVRIPGFVIAFGTSESRFIRSHPNKITQNQAIYFHFHTNISCQLICHS